MCEVVGCDTGEHDITPLAQILWSQESPDFVSENHEILTLVDRVLAATEQRGILIYDRGGDRREMLIPWTKNEKIRYLARQRGDRHLLYKGKAKNEMELAETCKTPYAETVVKEKDGEEKTYFIHFGYLPVRLPECPKRPLSLLVVKGFGKNPMLLLTTKSMRKSRKVLWWALKSYLTRWRVEDTIRFFKQSYGLENVRVPTYRRLKNLVALLLAVMHFTAVRLGMEAKMKILALHALDATKRLFGIPNFRYYALADGMKDILHKAGKGTLRKRNDKPPPDPQLPLFGS